MGLEPAGLTWVNENLNGYIRGIDEANSAMSSVEGAAHRAGSGFSILEGVVMGVASSLTTFAIDAAAKASQALIGLATDSIGVAAEFQSMGVNLEYAGMQYKEAADAVGGFDEIALQVGGDTRLMGVSATGAAGAMTGLLKSGLSLGDVMGDVNAYMEDGAELGGALRASIDLAAASELDMVQASDLAVVVMSTFGKSAEDITGAMDYMVKTADASVAEVSDLSQALINVGPTAKSAGMEFEDVNTALAMLSTRGIKGAEAGTALKSMLANIRRPTKSVREQLDKWGISLYDSNGQMYSMMEIIGQFQIGLEGATEQERALAIQTIAGTYGMNAMNALLDEGVEGWQEMTVAIGGATDMSAKAAAQSQTYAGQMEALQGVIETLRIRIGTALLPALTNVLQIFSSLIEQYGPQLTAMFEVVGAWLGKVAEEAARLIGIFMDIGWKEFFLVFEDGSSYAGSFFKALGLGEGVAYAIGNALSTVAQFVGELVSAFSGGWPEISAVLVEWAGKFWDWLVGPGGASGQVESIMSMIGDWFANNWPIIEAKLMEWAEKFWDWVRDVAAPAAQEKLDVISQAIKEWAESESTQASITELGRAIGVALVDGVELLVSAAETWTPIMVGLAGAISKAAVQAALPALRAVGEGLASGVAEGVADKLGIEISEAQKETISEASLAAAGPLGGLLHFSDQLDEVEKGWKKLRKFFGKEGKEVEKDVTKPFEKAADETEDIFKDLSKELVGRSIIPDMMDEMESIISSSLGSIYKMWQSAWELVTRATRDAWKNIVSAIQSGVSDILSALNSAMRDFESKGRDIAESIADGIQSAWRQVTSAISDGMGDAIGAVRSALGSLVSAGRDIAESIASGVRAAWNRVTSAIDMNSLRSAISAALGSLVQAGRDIANSIANGISAAWSYVYSTLSSLASGLVNAVFGVGSVIANSIVNGISQGLNIFWSGVKNTLSSLASGLATAVDWASKVANAGAEIVDGIIDGVIANWSRFVDWLKNAIAGIFGASEPTNPLSPFRSEKLTQSGERIGDALVRGIQASLAGGLIAPYAMPAVAGRSANISIGPIMVSGGLEGEAFAQRIRQVVAGEL